MRATVALIPILLLAGCTAPPASEPSPTVTIPLATLTVTPSQYLTLMRTIPEFNTTDDAALVHLGESTCTVMRADGWKHVMQTFAASGNDLEQSYAAVQYAVAAYCPDLLSTIPAQ